MLDCDEDVILRIRIPANATFDRPRVVKHRDGTYVIFYDVKDEDFGMHESIEMRTLYLDVVMKEVDRG